MFGLYLYLSVCWFHVHYDEAFSALRIADHKGLTRLHITPEGDLELFTLATGHVPTVWREDPRWRAPGGGGCGTVPSHEATWPSRWVPAPGACWDEGAGGTVGDGSNASQCQSEDDGSMGMRVVDYLRVPRRRPGLTLA